MGGGLAFVLRMRAVVPGCPVHRMHAGLRGGMQRRRDRRHPAGEHGAENGENEENLSHAARDRRSPGERKGTVQRTVPAMLSTNAVPDGGLRSVPLSFPDARGLCALAAARPIR